MKIPQGVIGFDFGDCAEGKRVEDSVCSLVNHAFALNTSANSKRTEFALAA